MEIFLSPAIVNAYLEMCVGVAALRTPEIDKALKPYPTFGIKSSYTDNKEDLIIKVDNVLKDIKKESLKGSPKIRTAFTQLNSIFLIAMWDVLVETNKYNTIKDNEDIQFFRHIRNGSAHGNKFEIRREITQKAQWRDKEITRSLHNTIVMPDFLKDGDVYLLLHEIDKKYFKTY